ncbi:Holliday junction branch migration protein RuvA [Leucobacter allii]|uniref:Holliday junction branch migration protein RuvA n=1 Tax=Leucobacter allii TaxID=2932247 RepID=UPI003D2D729C
MIASIRGPVLSAGAGWLVVGVGGIGLRVEVPSGRVSQAVPGDEVALHTSLVVREDSLTLFGFRSEDELALFGLLIGVNGVGPRSALGVLSVLAPADVVRAVANEDAKPFTQVSGIGPKTAKLIALSLSGKLSGIAALAGGGDGAASAAPAGDAAAETAVAVREGLVGLGWQPQAAERAVDDARAAGAPEDSAGLLRAALALLQAGRPGARGAGR